MLLQVLCQSLCYPTWPVALDRHGIWKVTLNFPWTRLLAGILLPLLIALSKPVGDDIMT